MENRNRYSKFQFKKILRKKNVKKNQTKYGIEKQKKRRKKEKKEI